MKKLAVFDIDGTLYRWQLYYEVVLKLLDRGFFTDEAAENIRAQYFAWQSREASFREFEHVALDAYQTKLSELHTDLLREIADEIIAESGHKVYSYTRHLASTLKEQGYFLLAISGSQQEIAEPFAKRYGFDACIGWIYEQKDGIYTGETSRKTVGNKAALLREFAAAHDLSLEDSVGIGDSGGDVDMLMQTTRSIAFNPAVELLEAAKEQGWEIVVERKNISYQLKRGTDGLYLLAEANPV